MTSSSSTPLSTNELNSQAERFEAIGARMRADMHTITRRLTAVSTRREQFLILKKTLSALAASEGGEASTMIDIGSDVFMHATIPDTSMVSVNVGLGFFVDMTREESMAYIEKETSSLSKEIDELERKLIELQSKYELMSGGVASLKALGEEETS